MHLVEKVLHDVLVHGRGDSDIECDEHGPVDQTSAEELQSLSRKRTRSSAAACPTVRHVLSRRLEHFLLFFF